MSFPLGGQNRDWKAKTIDALTKFYVPELAKLIQNDSQEEAQVSGIVESQVNYPNA